MFSGNENDRQEVRQFIQVACTRLARAIGGAVLLCSHPSLSGLASGKGTSGSTGWNNSVRSRLYLSRPKPVDGEPEDLDARLLEKVKSNYSRTGDAFNLRWSDGVLILEGSSVCKGEVARIDESNIEKLFLDLLGKLRAQGTNASANPRGTYAPKIIKAQFRDDTKGISVKQLEIAMRGLMNSGRIIQESFGPPSKCLVRLSEVQS